MADIKIALPKVLKHEGGYVNDPLDNGGETICGIARKSWPNWSGWKKVDTKLKNIPSSQKTKTANELLKDSEFMLDVQSFYASNFWTPLRLNEVHDQAVAENIFDFAVNSGIQRAVKKLQIVLKITADGQLGPNTLKAINAANPDKLVEEYKTSRRNFIHAIVRANPSQARFINGWLNRVEAV